MRGAATVIAIAALAAGPAATRPTNGRRTYECRRPEGEVVIDGKLDETAWADVAWTEEFVTLTDGEKSPEFTRAKMVWDEKNLYVAAELRTPHVRATLTRHDANLFMTDSVLELFIDPDGDGRNYAEMQFNALGTVMDLLMDKPYDAGGHYDMKWDVAGIRVGVSVDGTLNDSGDEDKGWTVEVAIPWKSLAGMAGRACPPSAGDEWRVQLARCERPVNVLPSGKYGDAAGELASYSAWSPMGLPGLHVPDRWGVVRFAGGAISSPKP